MIKPLMAVVGAGLLLGACNSRPEALTAPPPSMAQAPWLVFFDWDKSKLSPQAMATVSQAAQAYKATSGARISTVGNTDTSGSTDYNMALSMRRADAVKSALIENGVPAAAIESAGRGQTNLLVATADGVREAQNRRVELAGLQGQASRDQASTDIVTARVIDVVKSKIGASHEAALREGLRNDFDWPYMGRLALGIHWNEASEQQRARFLAALETGEVRSYSERLGKLAGFTLTIVRVVSRPNSVDRRQPPQPRQRPVDQTRVGSARQWPRPPYRRRENRGCQHVPDKALGVQFLHHEQWRHGRAAGQRTGSPRRPPMKPMGPSITAR
jgi:hypothetical protein